MPGARCGREGGVLRGFWLSAGGWVRLALGMRVIAVVARVLCGAGCVFALSGCKHFTSWQEKEKPFEDTKPAEPVKLPESAQTLADTQLARAVENEQALFQALVEQPNRYTVAERDRRFGDVAAEYEAYLARNQDSVYGFILYGKFLRRIGENTKALVAFLRANRLDPNLGVVKQQIGTLLAEEGRYQLALPYFLAAIRLAPEVAVYQYQLGELIAFYRDSFVERDGMDGPMLDRQMLAAFESAARLAPEEPGYRWRFAEAFYDVGTPDWERALAAWGVLEDSTRSEAERDVVRLHMARVLTELGRFEEAEAKLNATVDRPVLRMTRAQVQEAVRARVACRPPKKPAPLPPPSLLPEPAVAGVDLRPKVNIVPKRSVLERAQQQGGEVTGPVVPMPQVAPGDAALLGPLLNAEPKPEGPAPVPVILP